VDLRKRCSGGAKIVESQKEKISTLSEPKIAAIHEYKNDQLQVDGCIPVVFCYNHQLP
jgi:hypothetical protein